MATASTSGQSRKKKNPGLMDQIGQFFGGDKKKRSKVSSSIFASLSFRQQVWVSRSRPGSPGVFGSPGAGLGLQERLGLQELLWVSRSRSGSPAASLGLQQQVQVSINRSGSLGTGLGLHHRGDGTDTFQEPPAALNRFPGTQK